MRDMDSYLLTNIIGLLAVTELAEPTTTTIVCNGSAFVSQFNSVFALDLTFKNKSELHITKDNNLQLMPNARLNVKDKQGSFIKNNITFQATVDDFECHMVAELKCELFGYTNSPNNYQPVVFTPIFNSTGKHGDVTVSVFKKSSNIGEVNIITCSVYPETDVKNWTWEIQEANDSNFTKVMPQNVLVILPNWEKCQFQTTSKLIYITKERGDVTFNCSLGRSKGVVSIAVGSRECLGLMFTLSTMILVYMHFIVLPFVFSKWNNFFTYRRIQNTEDFFMRKMRTVISCVLGLVFLATCLPTCLVHLTDVLFYSYLAFTVTEFIFIEAYAVIRFLSTINGNTNNGILKNARVMTSFGAVLIPIAFWVVIRIQGGTCPIGAEVFFYIATIVSIIGFVFVSFDREGEYWDKNA